MCKSRSIKETESTISIYLELRPVKPRMTSSLPNKNDFRIQLVVNNCLDSVIIDTGAQVSVCRTVQSKRWNMLDGMIPSEVKIKPYKSDPTPVHGQARYAHHHTQDPVNQYWQEKLHCNLV